MSPRLIKVPPLQVSLIGVRVLGHQAACHHAQHELAVQQLVGAPIRRLTTTDTFTIGRVCQGSAPEPSTAVCSTWFKLSRLRAFLTMACRARGPAWRRSCGSALTIQDLCTPLAARPR